MYFTYTVLLTCFLFVVVQATILYPNISFDACDPNQPEGAKCTCGVASSAPSFIIYDCRQKALTSIPSTYGNDTIEINLSNNKIIAVEKRKFTNLRSLEFLYLQANYIRYIEQGAFNGLMKLKEISLNSNRLENISNGVFDHLPALETVHMENNYITTIGRYAFFTTPSLQLINLDNNPLTCGCEEKFFREYLDVRVGILTLSKARCNNYNNDELATISTSRLSACIGDSLFVKNNYCYTCADANSPRDCGYNNTAEACSGMRDVCFMRVEYKNNHLGVSGGCSDYTSCMTHEAANEDTCRKGQETQCHYCTLGKRTNRNDVLNTVKTFEIVATVTLDETLTPALQDPTSLTRKNYEVNFVNQVNSIVNGQKGSYSIAVTDIRSPYLTVELAVKCSTVWHVSKQQVLKALNDSFTAYGYYLNGSQLLSLHLNLKADALSVCFPESIHSATFGTFDWPQTNAGVVSLISCPNADPDGRIITASRPCIHSGNEPAKWGKANIEQCYPLTTLPADLQQLAGIRVTDRNVIEVSKNVSELSKNWDAYTEYEISWTLEIIEGILDTNAMETSRDAIQNTLLTLNNILYIDSTTLEAGESEYGTSNRVVNAFDKLLAKTDVETKDFGEVQDNMAGFVLKTTPNIFSGISLSTDVSNESPLTSGKVDIDTSGSPVGNGMSGIQIPTTVFAFVPARNLSQISKGTFSVYREAKIFDSILSKPTPREIIIDKHVGDDEDDEEEEKKVLATRQINSHVLGASFPGVSIKNLKEPVKVRFQHFMEAVNPECVYWKKSDIRSGIWSDEGCTVNVTGNGYTVCDCDHLTNFALLMDVYGSGGQLSDADKMALAVISYIGCGISFLAMCLTIITFTMFKKLRKKNPGKILMNLCVAIGLADLVFVAGMQSYTSNSPTGCKVVATLLHFFLLAAFCWMSVEAFYMYLALVKVFNTYIARFQLKSSLFGWGIPFVIVVLTLGINKTDNYGIQPGGICWLSRIPFYTAFLGPAILIIIVNAVVFVFIMKQIVNRSSNKLTKTEKSSIVVRLRGAISVIILLGLTWVFAIFAVGDFGLVFHYLFAIFNSLQGLFILIFYCFLKSDVRNLWKRKCTCFKSPYETTDTASKSRDKGYSSSTDQTLKTNVGSSQSPSDSRRPSDHNGKVSPAASPALKPPTAFRGRWQLQHSEPRQQTVDSSEILSFTDA